MLVIYGRMLASASRSCLTATQTPNGIRVAIANFVNEKTGYAWPSQDTIARKASLTRQTVNKAIKSLVRKNYLVSVRRSDKGKSTSNIYQINRVAFFDCQQHHVAENDNEVSNSSAEVCKGELHKPLGTTIETLNNVKSADEEKSGQFALPASNDNAKPFRGPPKDGAQFWSLPINLRHFYAKNSPNTMRDLVATGFTYDIHKDIA